MDETDDHGQPQGAGSNPAPATNTPEQKADGAANAAGETAAPSGDGGKPRGRGRPPGATDKRPRKLRPSGAAAKPKAPPPPKSPLAGEVDGDEQKDKPRAKKPVKDLEDLFMLPAEELSSMAVSMVNMIVVSQVQRRAGLQAAQAVNLTSEESGKIEKATTRVLEKYLPQLGCEWALAFTVVVIYVNKWSDVQLSKAGVTREQAMAMAQAHAAELQRAADERAAGNGAQA